MVELILWFWKRINSSFISLKATSTGGFYLYKLFLSGEIAKHEWRILKDIRRYKFLENNCKKKIWCYP